MSPDSKFDLLGDQSLYFHIICVYIQAHKCMLNSVYLVSIYSHCGYFFAHISLSTEVLLLPEHYSKQTLSG